ncbi:hypothetical protein E4T42_09014 [Aureobasidium subglaciale]|nr:hypothetical protein E4T42_09014 [Aureobasidium subglaciale]
MVAGLEFCAELLDKYYDLYQAGKADFVEPFLNKVSNDDAADYETLIPRPMWLARMAYRLTKNRYANVEVFVADFKLMILNCHENGRFLKSASQFENDFLSECSKKNILIAPFLRDHNDNDDNDDDDDPSKPRTTRSSTRQAGTPGQGTSMAGGRLSTLRRTTGAKRPRTQTERGTLGEPSTKRARKSGPVDDAVEEEEEGEEEEEEEEEAQVTAPPKRLTVLPSKGNEGPQPTLSDAVVASEGARQDAEEDVVNEQSTERAHTDDSPKHDEDDVNDVEEEEDEDNEVEHADQIHELVGDLRNTMEGEFQEFARHQYQLMLRTEATRDVYDKASREIWKSKCRARIINEAGPGSEVSIRAMMKQTWTETGKEQLMAILQKETESRAECFDV